MSGGVLALDLARSYGWAYIGPDGKYVASGHRELRADHNHGAQAHTLSMSIADLITEFAPDFLAIEKPIHGGGVTSFKTARALYGYATIAALVAHIREIGFVELARSSCCKSVLGNGRAKKADGVEFARTFKPLLNSDDEADAILVALAAHKMREAGAERDARLAKGGNSSQGARPARKPRQARPTAAQIKKAEAVRSRTLF